MSNITIDINGIIAGLIVWVIVSVLTWLSKRFASQMTSAPYIFAIIIIIPLSLLNLFLINETFNLDYGDYVYPTLFTVLLLLTHILIWKRPGISRHGKKIIKLFSQTGHEALAKEEITKALSLGVHKFDYLADRSINSGYLETDGNEFNYDGPNYWLTQKGRSFLARRFLL